MALTNLKVPIPTSILAAITNLFTNIFTAKGLVYIDYQASGSSGAFTVSLDRRTGKVNFVNVTVNANTSQTFTITNTEALEARMTIPVLSSYQSAYFVIQRCETLDGSIEIDIRNVTGSNYTGNLSVQFMISG